MRRTHNHTARAQRAALALGAGTVLASTVLANTVLANTVLASAAPALDGDNKKPSFDAPVRMVAADGPVQTESPGYATPAWYDVDGDGRKDLVVGQYADGKMALYRGQEDGSLGKKEWIMAGGEVAEVPDIW